MAQRIVLGPLTAYVREAWVLKNNLRLSAPSPYFPEPMFHALIVESVRVEEQQQRQGHCKRFLQALLSDRRFELIVVEGVQNDHLARALVRWGWDYDPAVMDFYWTSDREVEAR